MLPFVWRPFWPDPDRTGESDRQSSKQLIRRDLAVMQQDRLDGPHRLDSQTCASNALTHYFDKHFCVAILARERQDRRN